MIFATWASKSLILGCIASTASKRQQMSLKADREMVITGDAGGLIRQSGFAGRIWIPVGPGKSTDNVGAGMAMVAAGSGGGGGIGPAGVGIARRAWGRVVSIGAVEEPAAAGALRRETLRDCRTTPAKVARTIVNCHQVRRLRTKNYLLVPTIDSPRWWRF